MGPAKFGSFLFLTAFLGKSLELALCVQFPRLRPPSGPLATLAALSTMYYGERSVDADDRNEPASITLPTGTNRFPLTTIRLVIA